MEHERHDLDAERAIIGAALLSTESARELTLSPDDFYEPRHAAAWSIIAGIIDAGENLDLVVMNQHIRAENIPGLDGAYLHTCIRAVTTTGAAGQHAKIVSGLAQLRRVREAGVRAVTSADAARWDTASSVLDTMRGELAEAEANVHTPRGSHFSQVMAEALDEYETPTTPPFSTGWPDLDEKLNGGWKPGQLTIVGARPSIGKSQAGVNIAVNTDDAHRRVWVYNLEMNQSELAARIIAVKAAVPTARLERAKLNEAEWAKVARVQAEAEHSSITITSDPVATVADMRGELARAAAHGQTPHILVVDYLQLITPAARDKAESRERQVSNLARDLKVLGLQYGVHIVALAQLNRGPAGRADPRPRSSDLRESGGLEQHADNVILLHRDDEENPGIIEYIIDKNRHGATGTVELAWIPSRSTISNLSRVDEREVRSWA